MRSSSPEPFVEQAFIRWAFCGFVFSIPLEYPDRSIPLEVHTITGALFLAVALLQPRHCFRRPPAAFWALVVFVWVYLAGTIFSEHAPEAAKLFFNYALVTLLFWVAYNLMQRAALAGDALLAFVLGCTVVAILNVLGIATALVASDQTVRRIVFGQDANLLGGNMAIAIVIVAALATRSGAPLWLYGVAAAVGLLLTKSLMLSGSRGAILAVMAGLAASGCQTTSLRAFRRHAGIALLAALALGGLVYRSDALSRRYEIAISTGNMSGREQLYPEALQMFLERPVFGWRPIDNTYELGLRTSAFQIGRHDAEGNSLTHVKDTHNLALDVLTSTGLAGAMPLFICLCLCLWSAWAGRATIHGTIPLALSMVVLTLSMNSNWSASKQGWIIFAYAAASGSRAHVLRGTARFVPASAAAARAV